MRILFKVVFLAALLISAYLSYNSYRALEWETLTASLSLIIAVISAYVAYEVFHKQNEADNPQLIIDFDIKSRSGAMFLTIQNYGNKPAFNIKIEWETPLFDVNNELVRFGSFGKYDIAVLNKDRRISIPVDATKDYFDKHEDEPLDYSGALSYSLSIKSRKRLKQQFHISLDPFRKTARVETDIADTYLKMKTIPKKIEELTQEIARLRNTLDGNTNGRKSIDARDLF
ncbi:MAG: hypothetical protein ACO1NU_04370 [Arcticibacter sp.]